jgi:predicted nuclease of predicted toxin-antitoxin system
VDRRIGKRLRQHGRTAVSLTAAGARMSDDEVFKPANQQAVPLITAHQDFDEMVYRLGLQSHGVMSILLEGLSPADMRKIMVGRWCGTGNQRRCVGTSTFLCGDHATHD